MRIRVSTKQLATAASEAEKYIQIVEEEFNEIESIVRSSESFWRGDGQRAYLQTYIKRLERIQHSLNSFRENASDLRQIAGIYQDTERSVLEKSQSLPTDVII